MIFSAPNRARFNMLSTEMAREPLLLFTGAGASIDSGFPTWAELLRDLHDLALKEALEEARRKEKARLKTRSRVTPQFRTGKQGNEETSALSELITAKQWDYLAESSDALWRAEMYRRALPRKRYELYLQNTFSRHKIPGETALLLAKLRFRHCLTTNYEASLENAWKKVGKTLTPLDWTDRAMVRRFFSALEATKNQQHLSSASGPYLIYLHGRAHAPAEMVFSERDYIQRYVLSNDSYPRLLAMFMFHRVLFVGFSLNDAQFQTIFRVANAHLGESAGSPDHYMLTASENPDDPARDELNAMLLKSKYGISPVFYNPYGRHQGLKDVLRELHRLVRNGKSPQFRKLLANSAFANPEKPAPVLSLTSASARSLAAEPAKTRSKTLPSPEKSLPLLNPKSDDGRKGLFGRSRRRGPFRLWAIVEKDEDEDEWFDIEMSVFRKDLKRFDGPVTFYLHPTFHRSVVKVDPKKTEDRWEATLVRYAWGAFTVGVVIGNDPKRMDRRLELDLAALPNAPAKFRSR